MRVHDARFNSDYQMYALRAAADTEEQREAEQVRKQLHAASSMLAASEDEDCVVTLREREDGERQAPQQDQSDRRSGTQPCESGATGSDDSPYSEYA